VKARSVDLDVTSTESVAAALEPPDRSTSGQQRRISIVKPALEMPEKDWDAVVDTNLRGAWLLAQGAAKRWVADKRPGSIVNIGSILGLRTIGQVAPYNASKAGLIHLTRALAMEWAPYHIRVNAICPGYIGDRDEQRLLEDARRAEADRAHPAAPHRPARASRWRAVAAGFRCR